MDNGSELKQRAEFHFQLSLFYLLGKRYESAASPHTYGFISGICISKSLLSLKQFLQSKSIFWLYITFKGLISH